MPQKHETKKSKMLPAYTRENNLSKKYPLSYYQSLSIRLYKKTSADYLPPVMTAVKRGKTCFSTPYTAKPIRMITIGQKRYAPIKATSECG